MTNLKTTKRALLSSVVALLVCFTMLLGTTFAWFTDSVTSSGNIIQTGTLDVEMHWAEGKADPNAQDTVWTDASTGAIFNNDKWEPGYTEVRHIKISNEGTLALKYQLHIYANGDVSDLADVIDVYFVDPAVQVADRSVLNDVEPVGTLAEVLASMPGNASGDLLADETDTVTLALKMRENAGNEYQNKAIGSDFTIQLLATQLTAESDSFGDQYDVNAEFLPVNKSAEIINSAGTLGEAVVMTADMPYGTIKVTVPAGAQLSSNEVSSLTLTVKKAEIGYNGTLAANQVANGYEIYVDGIADHLNPFVDADGRNIYNYSDISVELPIGAGRKDVKVYKDGSMPTNTWASYDSATGAVAFSVDYFTHVSQAKKSNITVVYTKLSEAEKQLNEALEYITAGDSVTINSTANNTVSVNNIADALSGTSNIILVGESKENTIVVADTATISAESLTLKNMSVVSNGIMTINGSDTNVEDVNFTANKSTYGLEIDGSNSTIKNSVFVGTGTSSLMFNNGSDTVDSVTTIEGCTFKTGEGNGNKGGIRFYDLNGTLNITDSTIDVAMIGFEIGSTGAYKGTLNISDSTISSLSVVILKVNKATMTNVTFDDEVIGMGVNGKTNVFDSCEFNSNIVFNGRSKTNEAISIEFNNCTYNDGTTKIEITADNIATYLTFTNLLNLTPNLTVKVNGTVVTFS